MIKKYILSILFVYFSLSNMAVAALQVGGKIKNLYVNNLGVVLFKLDSAIPSVCLDQTWPFTFNTSDIVAKEWLSMLMTREATGKVIQVGYYGDGSNQCTVEYIYFLNN